MKTETKTNDIKITIATNRAAKIAGIHRRGVIAALDAGRDAQSAVERHARARLASIAADALAAKIPAPRRNAAAQTVKIAEEIAASAARCGGSYSGDTTYTVSWGDVASASTETSRGDQYSRSCTYKKTDAEHIVTLDPAGVSLLVEAEPLRLASTRDGMDLIALYPDDSAVWVRSKNKSIVAERGWIVGNGSTCYHSTKSRSHAVAGLAKKLAALEKERRAARLSKRENRRIMLVARLCTGATATLEDAIALGYCAPGIRSFQSRFGVGDVATLPQLVRTGDPNAVRLALKIARGIKRAAV